MVLFYFIIQDHVTDIHDCKYAGSFVMPDILIFEIIIILMAKGTDFEFIV